MKGSVAAFAVLPVVLATVFMVTDHAVAKAAQTDEYVAARDVVREEVDLLVYVLDGEYYDARAVRAHVDEAALKGAALYEEAQEVLVPLIDAAYDARLANVDGYLDWYYSLPADYERLMNLITGSVEEYVGEQFVQIIGAGVDDSELEGLLQGYLDQSAALKVELMAAIVECKVEDVPAWLLTVQGEMDFDALLEPVEPTERFLSAGERLGVSAVAGVGAGAVAGKAVAGAMGGETSNKAAGTVAKNLTSKAVPKGFFKTAVSRITGMLASKGIGSAVGGAAGTVGGPLGIAAGIAVGAAASVGVDYGLLKIDEAWNREEYKAEIIQSIEESRAELLAAVQGT